MSNSIRRARTAAIAALSMPIAAKTSLEKLEEWAAKSGIEVLKVSEYDPEHQCTWIGLDIGSIQVTKPADRASIINDPGLVDRLIEQAAESILGRREQLFGSFFGNSPF
jgi:hypothetical protein